MDGWSWYYHQQQQQQRPVSSHSLGPQFLESGPSIFGTGPYPKKMANLGGKNTWNRHQTFFTASEHIQNLHFAKKLVQIGQCSPQQWSEYFTAAYMGFPPPTRLSI